MEVAWVAVTVVAVCAWYIAPVQPQSCDSFQLWKRSVGQVIFAGGGFFTALTPGGTDVAVCREKCEQMAGCRAVMGQSNPAVQCGLYNHSVVRLEDSPTVTTYIQGLWESRDPENCPETTIWDMVPAVWPVSKLPKIYQNYDYVGCIKHTGTRKTTMGKVGAGLMSTGPGNQAELITAQVSAREPEVYKCLNPVNCPNGFSVMFWYRYASAATGEAYEGIVTTTHNSPSESQGFRINYKTSGNVIIVKFTRANDFFHGSDNIVMREGTWYHLGATYHLNKLHYFRDGELKVTETYTLSIGSAYEANGGKLCFGVVNCGESSNYGAGTLDEFLLFDVELTDAEMRSIFEAYTRD